MMFTPEDCEKIRRLADGVTPMGWIAVSCEPSGECMTFVTCRYRDPDPGIPDRILDVAIGYLSFIAYRDGLADYLRGLINAYIQGKMVHS